MEPTAYTIWHDALVSLWEMASLVFPKSNQEVEETIVTVRAILPKDVEAAIKDKNVNQIFALEE